MSEAEKIENWWAENPMTYGESAHGSTDYGDGVEISFGSKEMFDKVDSRFYGWNKSLHEERHFSKIFPYEKYKDKKVLEIGCGLGTMSMLWAQAGAQVTALDLNETSIKQTQKRFGLYDLKGEIVKGDGRKLDFEDESFDYVYSWGVLHHSPDLRGSVQEFLRVLKPGGGFGMMLYNRHSLLQKFIIEYIEGFLHYESAFLNQVELSSRYGDGANQEGNPYTWPVTRGEMKKLFSAYSKDLDIRILGSDLDYVLQNALPVVGRRLPTFILKSWARRLGWSLWISGTKDTR